MRFFSILLFTLLSTTCTIKACVRYLVKESKLLERFTLHFYTQLQVLFKESEYYTRRLLFIAILSSQGGITTTWWMVIKCWNILPIFMVFATLLAAIISTLVMGLLLPHGVEICDRSEKFVSNKTSSNHTFNKYSKNRYNYLKWKSQRMLAIHVGTQFTLSKSTPIQFFEILMINLTNAILLIEP